MIQGKNAIEKYFKDDKRQSKNDRIITYNNSS